MVSTLLQNAVWCKEDDVYLVSTHVHDFVTHEFKDGKSISVDGGPEYTRRLGDLYELLDTDRYEEWTLTDEFSLPEIADKLLWGTRGKNGTEPLRYRPIKEFSVEHLQAIVDGGHARPGGWANKVMRYWLEKKTT